MNISFYIAKRYLFSKKNRNAINIITGISIAVITVATAALIIVLSSMNGFGLLIDAQISTYAPDLKIQANKGKTFKINKKEFDKIRNMPGIKYFAEISEENVLLKYGEKQIICTVKGIPASYGNYINSEETVINGVFKTEEKRLNYAVFGGGIAYRLGVSVENGKAVSVWTPNRKNTNLLNPEQAFNKTNLIPAGIIAIDNEFDLKYILASNKIVRKITDRDSSTVSYVELFLDNKEELQSIKSAIETMLGEDFSVQDVYEQFDVYRVMKSERLAAFIIMLFITLVASFSIIGSVTMLIIEKRRDLFTLQSMGLPNKNIQRIFFYEGWLISFFGASAGIVAGALICFAQQELGLVTFPSDGLYIVEAYPVSMKVSDFVLTFFSVMLLGTLISFVPSVKLKAEFQDFFKSKTK